MYRYLTGFVSVGLAALASAAWAHGNDPNVTTIYLTRHADDAVQLLSTGPGTFVQDCTASGCCVERRNELGVARSDALAEWLLDRGVTEELDEVVASHKPRTADTVRRVAADAGLDLVDTWVDQVPGDGVHNVPSNPPECGDPAYESANGSLAPMQAYLHALPLGSTVLVAAHSGTLYPLLNSFGVETTDPVLFPGTATKVSGFNNLWQIEVDASGHGTLVNHWVLDLELDDTAHQRFGHEPGCSAEPADHDD